MTFVDGIRSCPWCGEPIDGEVDGAVWAEGGFLWHGDCLTDQEDSFLSDAEYDDSDGHA